MNTTDTVPVTPEEEEAWQSMETLAHVRNRAVVAAHGFTDDYKNELQIMTLRKAYEMGYVRGALDKLNGGAI